jgi:FkbM family methyltransferase
MANKKIFVDLGAYIGDTIDQFLKEQPDAIEYQIYGFEPNPHLTPALERVADYYPNVHIEAAAAWVKDEMRDFTIDTTESPMGSTLIPEKRNWGIGDMAKVRCFDFSKWLEQFEGDHVIVKMDIEGAEFEVLQKMIADGTDKIIHELRVETHPNKVHTWTTTQKDELLAKLSCTVKDWH